MPGKPIVEIRVVRPTLVEFSSDPEGEVTLAFETIGEADVFLTLPTSALVELEALLARASREQGKRQPKQ